MGCCCGTALPAVPGFNWPSLEAIGGDIIMTLPPTARSRSLCGASSAPGSALPPILVSGGGMWVRACFSLGLAAPKADSEGRAVGDWKGKRGAD